MKKKNEVENAGGGDASVLFSLEALTANADRLGEDARMRLAMRLPASGASGVIDLERLREEPRFDRGLVEAPIPVVEPAAPPAVPRNVLVGLMAGLAGAVIVLATLAVVEPTAAIVVERPRERVESLSVAELAKEPQGGSATRGGRTRSGSEAGSEPDAEAESEPEAEAESESESESDSPAVPRATKKAKTRRRAEERRVEPKAAPPVAKRDAAERPDVSVECILDPASCGGGQPKETAPRGTKPTTDALPDKPSTAQIRTALAGPKAKAKTCGPTHRAAAGTAVRVKLSIDGGTGKVTQATPLPPHATALGRCIAEQLGRATFPRFAKPAIGVVYTIRQ
jgi:hypothetical protein